MGERKEVHTVTRFGASSAEIFFELSFILFEFIINCYKFHFLKKLVSCLIVLVLSHLPFIFLNKPPLLEDTINFFIYVFRISFLHLINYLIVDRISIIVGKSSLFAETCSHTSFNESVQMWVPICMLWVFHLVLDVFIFTLCVGNY